MQTSEANAHIAQETSAFALMSMAIEVLKECTSFHHLICHNESDKQCNWAASGQWTVGHVTERGVDPR